MLLSSIKSHPLRTSALIQGIASPVIVWVQGQGWIGEGTATMLASVVSAVVAFIVFDRVKKGKVKNGLPPGIVVD